MRPATARALKRVDAWLTPLALALGQAARRVPGRRASERTLIVRPGGLGDVVCACMALESLGADPRDCDWLIEARSRPWAEHLGLRHRCYDAEPLALLSHALRCGHVNVINSEQRFGLAHAAALALSLPGGQLSCFSTSRGRRFASRVVRYDPERTHEVAEFARLLAHATGARAEPSCAPRVRQQAAAGPLVVGIAGVLARPRRLGLATWTRLVEAWTRGERFLVTAAPAERELARALVARFQARAELVAGGFADACAAVARAERVLTVDGGLVHVASYYGVPVTAVFTSGRPLKWAPLVPGSDVIRRSDLACQPCTVFSQTPPCPHAYACCDVRLPEHRIPIGGPRDD